MKKKVFSKLLMVALVATVGVFSSCKDYDDDISDVRNTIQTTATELRSDYNSKIELANQSITKLQTLYNSLDEAYKAADVQLNNLIKTQTEKAVTEAKAYSDANLATAKTAAQDAADAAEQAAKDYAKAEAAAAQAAAIAAAKEAVAEAQKTLSAALAKANETIATQGESIANLIKAREELNNAVVAAQARADQAYALADKANTLAETNKANLEAAANDIAKLKTDLANLQGTAADKATVSKLQGDLEALQKTVDNNVVDLASYKESITSVTSELAKLNSDLATAISNINESIAAVKSTADGNVAAIDAIKTQLTTIDTAWQLADQEIIKSINALSSTVDANKTEAAANLKSAVDKIIGELAAKQTLIENNDAAIKALLDTKVSELNKLIEGNAKDILANAKAIKDNKEAQDAANTVMQNDIAKNAKDIVAQGKDITNLDDAIKAIKKALGDDTAETLKAYAKSIAESSALQAKLDAQGYADAQDAAQKLTLMQAIKDQADQDAKAWTAAINLAIENLVTTYKLASLNEYIKTTAEAAQTAAEKNAAVKAQEIANKALADAKAYTDVLAQTLADNYTTTTDMQSAIETAKKAAISQAYLDVLNTLLRDYDEWYNMNDENKMNLELTPTIIELTKAAVEKYGLTKANAQDLIDANLEAWLKKPEPTGTYDKDGNPNYTPAGAIMAEILAAAEALQQEFTAKFEGLDARVADIEKILGVTLNADGDSVLAGKIFTASVNALIATATDAKFAALQDQLDGKVESELLKQIKAAAAQATKNANDIQAIDAAIANFNSKYAPFFNANADDAASESALATTFGAFTANINDLVARVKKNSDVIDNLGTTIETYVNEFLAQTVSPMVTSVNLFYNQHVAVNDGDVYGFDHNLDFIYVIEEDNKFPMDDYAATDIDFNQKKYVDSQIEFKKGTLRTYGDKILVRVSPVNATFTKDQVALINSKKEDIVGKGIVEVTNVERYQGPVNATGDGYDYITRGNGELNTGLWVISFKLKENEGQADAFDNFKKAAITKINNQEKQILYSVGIRNTNFAADDDRFVVSEYDLGLTAEPADHSWNFDVNDETVAKIHNRYIVNENKPNNGVELWTEDKQNYEDSYWDEFTYIFDYQDPIICAGQGQQGTAANLYYDAQGNIIYTYPGYVYSDFKYEGTGANVTNRYKYGNNKLGGYMTNGIDNRHDFPIKVINEKDGWFNIKIQFPKTLCGRHTDIKAFYVTLDQNFARESTTSEVSAWTGYIYDGVGFQTVNGFDTKTGKYRIDTQRNDTELGIVNGIRPAKLFVKEDGKDIEGVIKVKDARGAKGDIIGFRVFAVNLDGTLYDPDGRAFYVKLGDEGEEHTLNFDVQVFKQVGDSAIQKSDIVYDETHKDLNIVGYNALAAAADPIENPFFNMFTKEQNKGGQYTFEWTWAENDAKVRGLNNDIYSPLAGTTGYTLNTAVYGNADLISELFTFSYTSDNKDPWSQDAWVTSETTPITVPGSSIVRFNYNGTAEIKNVKVTLKDAARLQDEATYHLKLVIRLKDAEGAESVVNTINVNVKKTMPKALPDDFAVRIGQENFAKNVDFYLRAYTKHETWKITKWFDYTKDDYGKSTIDNDADLEYTRWAFDSRPYNFEEIFVGLVDEKGVFDENYKFVFTGCGDFTKDMNGVTGDAVTTFKMYPYNATGKWSNDMKYQGLDTDKQLATMDPGYYLPYVHYGVIGKTVAVKAGYFYRNISFNPANLAQVDFELTPDYFDKDGNFVAEASAAFKANFKCAIDPTFKADDHYSVLAYDATGAVDANHDGVGTAGANGTNTTRDQKWIPYGNKFIIALDSVGVTWKSILGSFVDAATTPSASYFKTNFTTFTNSYVTGQTQTDEKAAYYVDTLATLNPLEKEGYLYSKLNQTAAGAADYVRLVGIDAPEITKVVIYSAKASGNPAKLTVLATLTGASLNRVSDYFNVTKVSTAAVPYGLQFEPKVNSLAPTEIGKFEITVGVSTLKLVHQWAHTKAVTDNPKTITVYNPKSTPETEARQAR